MRFLIASIAFGVLYSLLMYRSPWRRVAFIAASVVVPIIANGLRAVGIVALGHVLGSAKAAATDHVLYGWLFFSLVILILIALGLPFREDIGPTRGPARSVVLSARPKQGGGDHWGGAAIAGFLVLLLAAVSPAVATQLDRAAQPQTGAVQALNFGPACIDVASEMPTPLDVAGRLVTRRIACDGQIFDVQIVVFGVHSTAAPVLAAERVLTVIPNITHDENFQTGNWYGCR